MRRFCLVTTFYPPFSFGGDAVFVRRLAESLARRGDEVHVVHDGDGFDLLAGEEDRRKAHARGYEDDPAIHHHSLKRGRSARLKMLLDHQTGRPRSIGNGFAELIEHIDPDVTHFHNVSLLGGPGILEGGRGVRLCTLHDYWFVCPTHALWRYDDTACDERRCTRCTLSSRRPPQMWRRTDLAERMLPEVDRFLAPSRFSVDRHRSDGFAAPIEWLPHFSLPPAGTPEGGERASSKAARPYFVYAGRLEPLKGPQTLIEAFRHFDDADLVIAGHGGLTPSLRADCADLPHVRLTGWIDEAALAEWLAGATALIIPSLCFETFGLIGIEAFAARTPVLARRIGALEELVSEDSGGLTYDDDPSLVAAMKRLLQPDLREELAARAQQSWRRHYTEQRHLDRYDAIIEDVEKSRRVGA